MALNRLTFQDLYNEVSKFLGTYGSSGPTGDDLTEAKTLVHRGYRRYVQAYPWSFLRKTSTLNIQSGDYEYYLPEDFHHILVDFRFTLNTGYPPIVQRSQEWIAQARAETQVSSYPEYFTIIQGDYTPQTGSRYLVQFWPTPNQDWTLYYAYVFAPPKLDNDTDLPIGDVEQNEALLQCCIAAAELSRDEVKGIQEQTALERVAEAIVRDKHRTPRHLGSMDTTHTSIRELTRGEFRLNNVSYNL